MRNIDNSHMRRAQQNINDEFYTRYEDIQKEVEIYRNELAGKVIYCNCDNWQHSNFVKYFKDNFKALKLKQFYATGYEPLGKGYFYQYDGSKETKGRLKSTGDYKSAECRQILGKSDLIITNPPFSLFREFIRYIIDKDKDFLIIGNLQATSYNYTFDLIRSERVKIGSDRVRWFECNGELRPITSYWFTTLKGSFNRPPIKLTMDYCPKTHKKYDDYEAINCDKTAFIPKNYDGLIGVPITFFGFYCREQFEIIDTVRPHINGKAKFQRIIIKHRK